MNVLGKLQLKKGSVIAKIMSIFWLKILFSYLKDRIIYFYQFIGFGIYAVPGYANSINEYGILAIVKAIMLFSIVMFIIRFTVKYFKQSYKIRISFKRILLDFIFNFISLGYLLYYQYCSNIYVYVVPVFGTFLLILIKKVKQKKLPEGKE